MFKQLGTLTLNVTQTGVTSVFVWDYFQLWNNTHWSASVHLQQQDVVDGLERNNILDRKFKVKKKHESNSVTQ